MLRRLQRGFIWTNMLLVGIVLCVVFVIVYANTYSNHLVRIDNSLRNSIEFMEKNKFPVNRFDINMTSQPFYRPNNNMATVTVTVNSFGEVTSSFQDLTRVSQEYLDTMVAEVLPLDESRGFIGKKSFRYLRFSTNDTTYISFASMDDTKANMQKVLFISIILASCSMVIFFLISLFMSKLAINPVKRAWQQQQQFLADASHELRTPLTVILANNNILLSRPEAMVVDQKKWLYSTQAEATHMKNLIDNLLYLARSDAAADNLPFVKIPLSEELLDNVLQFEPVAFEGEISLKTNIDPNLWIMGNPTQIKQLIHILMDNAFKYAGAGGKVHASLNRRGNVIRLTIHNTGEPIPPEDLPHIFERFYRSDKARTQLNGEGGYGLGLAIAGTIAKSHKGKITVTSSKEAGTTFTVSFKI
ncbi:MAG: sensor histidine kinase [Anaerovoracaceae bacterium]|jgi:two-component system sensor histidine kinase CiaH